MINQWDGHTSHLLSPNKIRQTIAISKLFNYNISIIDESMENARSNQMPDYTEKTQSPIAQAPRPKKLTPKSPGLSDLSGLFTAELNPIQDIDVGRQLREVRASRELSLRALAKLSGLNVNTLSLIENGRTSPSVSTLQQLAAALQVPITAFFESEPAQKSLVFQKRGQRPRAALDFGALEDLGAGLTLRGGQPLLVTLKPGAGSGDTPIVHTGHEFVYCLEGQLEYSIQGEKYLLEPGDSLIFEAHMAHKWRNAGSEVLHSMLIICPTDDNDRPTERHFIPE
jgi:transcriptional regulator with XRE-family HTH domain